MPRILIAEDSATQGEQLRLFLESAGYESAVVANGSEALARFEREEFDLVVTDVMMPGVDGYELCRRIKSGQRDVPVVLLTTLREPMDIIKGLEAGADNFVTKPYASEYIVGRIRSLLENRRLQTEGELRVGLEIVFMGRRVPVSGNRGQILEMLVSAFEEVVEANRALREREAELADAKAQLEGRVAASQERYRQLLEQAADGIVVAGEDGRIVEVNRRLEGLLGRRAEEMIGRPAREIIGLDSEWDLGRQLARRDRPLRGLELVLQRPSGGEVEVEITLSRVELKEGGGAMALLRDVSGRRRTERRVLAQHDVAQELSTADGLEEVAPALLGILAQAGGFAAAGLWWGQPGEVRYLAEWRRGEEPEEGTLRALPAEELLAAASGRRGPTWQPALSDDPSPLARAAVAAGMQAAIALPIAAGQQPRGLLLFLDPRDEAPDEGLLAMLQAVGSQLPQFCQRKSAADDLRRSEERYRALFEASPLPQWLYERDSDRILTVNETAIRHYGYSREEFLR